MSETPVLVMPLTSIIVGRRHRRDAGDVRGLADSIERVGLLHPPVVTPDGVLVAGHRRLEALKLLGWTETPVTVVANLREAVDLLRAERDENVVREPFAPSEAVALADALEPLLREEARRRQEASRARPGERADSRSVVESFHGAGKARDKVAAAVGLSSLTLKRARAIVQAAQREPGRFSELVAEMDRTGRVNGAHHKLRVEEARRKVANFQPATGEYGVIVIDPPWPYEVRTEDATHRGRAPYPAMSIDEIKALPVPAADDAVLWLWTTNVHLPVAFGVMEAWGFQYKVPLTWVKPHFGLGNWLLNQTEHCLMAVRGRPPITLMNQSTVLHAPAREHSEKPAEFFALVESLCPDPRRLEMFARERRAGWVTSGAEVPAEVVA